MKRLYLAFAVVTAITLSCKKKDDGPPPTTPLVTTAALSNVNIGAGTATAGGSIVSDGGAGVIKSGIVWSKTNNTPALTDSMVVGTTATGTFTSNITGLDFNNTYYFRAFATNSIGTGYGSVVTLTTSSDSVRFTYNGQSVTYGIITSPTTGKKWLDRNLGAKQVATAYNDYLAYGDLFQWGRPADGHQLINWTSSSAGTPVNGTTPVKATSDIPGHSNFILPAFDPVIANYLDDWRSDNNLNRWKTVPQGPCPAGWHVPTASEWQAEAYYQDGNGNTTGGTAISGGIKDRATGYNLLKLSTAGTRRGVYDNTTAGTIRSSGSSGQYSCSGAGFESGYNVTHVFVCGTSSINVPITPPSPMANYSISMSNAYSVRCIKD